jgi:hypothetical protein
MKFRVYSVQWRRVADRAIFTNYVPVLTGTTTAELRKRFLKEGVGVVHSVMSVTRNKEQEKELAAVDPWV